MYKTSKMLLISMVIFLLLATKTFPDYVTAFPPEPIEIEEEVNFDIKGVNLPPISLSKY